MLKKLNTIDATKLILSKCLFPKQMHIALSNKQIKQEFYQIILDLKTIFFRDKGLITTLCNKVSTLAKKTPTVLFLYLTFQN